MTALIPEPSDPLGLWQRVKLYSGWPQSNEDQVRLLAESWTAAGHQLDEPAQFDAGIGRAAWPDDAGSEFASSVESATTKAAIARATAAQLADAASSFAALVTGVKQGLTDLISANLAAYASLATLPLGVRGVAQESFVSLLGGFARSVTSQAAGQAAAVGAVKPAVSVGTSVKDPLDAVPPPPPPGSDPATVKRWWDSVPADLRKQYINEHAEQLGSLNGIPADVRDTANQLLLGRRREGLEQDRANLQAQLDALPVSSDPDENAQRDILAAAIRKVDGKLEGVKSIQNVLAPDPNQPKNADGYFLLGLDTDNDGRFIVAHGNPDTAANVATFVPGSLTNLASAGSLLHDADALRQSAIRAGSGSTSVITWLDYDAPDTIGSPSSSNDATMLGSAQDGAVRLAEFQQGLRATHVGLPSHNTLVGHSYGSTVTGLADSGANNAQVDDIVGAGSPGLGVETADQLYTGRDHTWVIESPHDPVADAGQVLPGQWDPSTPAFGARVYNAEAGLPVGSAPVTSGSPLLPSPEIGLPDYDMHSHNLYFDENSASRAGLDRMGHIIAGHAPPD